MAKIADIANIVAGLKAYYPNYNPVDPGQTAVMLMQILGDLPVDTLQAAMLSLCSEPRQFAPSAGEIRWQALKLHAKAEGIPDTWQAYEEVCKMPPLMVENGYADNGWQTVLIFHQWSHPLVQQVAETMGWPHRFPTDSPEADRAQFNKAYENALNRLMSDSAQLPQITTYIEKQKSTGSFLVHSGNKKKELEYGTGK